MLPGLQTSVWGRQMCRLTKVKVQAAHQHLLRARERPTPLNRGCSGWWHRAPRVAVPNSLNFHRTNVRLSLTFQCRNPEQGGSWALSAESRLPAASEQPQVLCGSSLCEEEFGSSRAEGVLGPALALLLWGKPASASASVPPALH